MVYAALYLLSNKTDREGWDYFFFTLGNVAYVEMCDLTSRVHVCDWIY